MQLTAEFCHQIPTQIKINSPEETKMANDKKCAHLPCVCVPANGEKYCSQFCKDAGSEETEIACDCGHPACSK
jgi:hypothetical protein